MLATGLRPLRHRTFALFWGSGAASDIGTWVQLAAIGSLIAASSGSALSTGMIAAATFAPQGICSPIGGLFADRFERRRVFLTTLGFQAVLTGLIAVVIASGVRNPTTISLMVLFQSSAGALGQPSLQAILPDLVPPEELGAAVALGITSWNSGRIVGPLVATALVPLGVEWAVGANAISYVVLWFAIRACRTRFIPPPRHRPSFGRELLAGIQALRDSRGCSTAVWTLVALHIVVVPFMGLIPATARDLLVRTGSDVSDGSVTSVAARLLSAQGIGAITGSLMVATLMRRFERSRIATTAMCALAVLAPLHQLAPSWLVTAVLIVAMGASVATLQSVFGAVVQRDASIHHRGRILSWYSGLTGLSYGIGLLGMGAMADRWGLRVTFLCSGIAVAALVVWTHRSSAWSAAIDGREPQTAEQVAPALG